MGVEFKFPDEISPLGESPNKNLDFYRQPKHKVKQISLRVGEVVRGQIINVLSTSQAIINLPDGTFTAEISGKFRSGDELFFKVQAIEPTLVLRIYSVFTKINNKEISTDELLRMLDLPNTKIFQLVTERKKQTGNVVFRDEVLGYVGFANKILEKSQTESLESIIKFIDFSLGLRIEPDFTFFQIFKSFSKIGFLFQSYFSALLTYFDLFPKQFQERLLNFRNANRTNDSLTLFQIFGPNFFKKENNFWSFVNELSAPSLLNSFPNEIQNVIKELKLLFVSFLVVNTLSSNLPNSFLYFLFPFFTGADIKFAYVRVKRKKIGNKFSNEINVEDEELISPVLDTLKKEFESFWDKEEKNKDFSPMFNEYKTLYRKEGNKIIVKTLENSTFIFKQMDEIFGERSKISIVI
ncbi:MAG: hypothetical protein N2517_05860 [Ignavibacteria bacterium]|nr:hypothetical protein [Ignavibacteria bacterium]